RKPSQNSPTGLSGLFFNRRYSPTSTAKKISKHNNTHSYRFEWRSRVEIGEVGVLGFFVIRGDRRKKQNYTSKLYALFKVTPL
ncbi:hypothetical protein VIGAN_10175500, partial [Vigna angularis var. angularis]